MCAITSSTSFVIFLLELVILISLSAEMLYCILQCYTVLNPLLSLFQIVVSACFKHFCNKVCTVLLRCFFASDSSNAIKGFMGRTVSDVSTLYELLRFGRCGCNFVGISFLACLDLEVTQSKLVFARSSRIL